MAAEERIVTMPMVPRIAFLLALIVTVLFLGCAEARSRPAAPAWVPVVPAPTADAKGAPSEALKRSWPFDAPRVAVYVDAEGLVRTQWLQELMRSRTLMAKVARSASQQRCIDEGFASLKEFAGGEDGRGRSLFIYRLDPRAAKAIGEKCLPAFTAADYVPAPCEVEGASVAWSFGEDQAAALTTSGLFIAGDASLVRRAARGREDGTSLGRFRLGPDEYVAWQVTMHEAWAGTVLVSNERFRVSARAEFASEEDAKTFETAFAKMRQARLAPSVTDDAQGLGPLEQVLRAFGIARDGRRLVAAFELRESPADQARDAEVAAALVVSFVQRLVDAKNQAQP